MQCFQALRNRQAEARESDSCVGTWIYVQHDYVAQHGFMLEKHTARSVVRSKSFGKEEFADIKKKVTESHLPRIGVVMPFAQDAAA